jgi:hypothetical protein
VAALFLISMTPDTLAVVIRTQVIAGRGVLRFQ